MMNYQTDFHFQETPSVYFNNIIKRDVTPVTVENLEPSNLEHFNRQVELAFADEAQTVKKRLRYLVPYIIQNIDWQEYRMPIEAWQLKYYYQRKRFIEKTGLDWDKFMTHKPMQRALNALGLIPEPVFEFILFLKYYYNLRSDLRFSCIEQFEKLMAELDKNRSATVVMDVNIGGKHYKISNSCFLQKMFQSVDRTQLSGDTFVNDFNQGSLRDKIRALDYYMVKTLLDYLPTDKSLRCGGRFSQAERNFGLSVLSVCGRLPDIDREEECSQDNNVTFDKLMRDFTGAPIPFAMELFL